MLRMNANGWLSAVRKEVLAGGVVMLYCSELGSDAAWEDDPDTAVRAAEGVGHRDGMFAHSHDVSRPRRKRLRSAAGHFS